MKEKFEMLLDYDEEIIWSDGTNVSAYVKKNFFKTLLFGLFPPVAIIMLGVPYSWLILLMSLCEAVPIWVGIAHFCFSIVACIVYIIVLYKNAKNTFLCVTNKRVIKRSGAFASDFKHYSLKNIGNVNINGSIFDSKGNNPSANIVITVKNFHTDTNGNSNLTTLVISSINNAYEAYKVINKLTEGNNESFRVKVE
jgi:hypothetical protein